MPEPSTSGLTADRVVAAYFKIKAQQAAFHRKVAEIDAEYDAKLEKLQNHLLGILVTTGQDSFRAAGGTVYKHKDRTPIAADWSLIYSWIENNQAWDMLERRLKKTFVQQYMDTNQGAIPPGVSVITKWVAKIRHTPKKKEALTDDD